MQPFPFGRHDTAEQFVRAWQAASSVAEAAAVYGCAPQSARAYASAMRAYGVPLKRFPANPGKPKFDLRSLTRLAKGLANGR